MGQGLRAYALFWAIMALPMKLYLDDFLASGNPVLSAGESRATYLMYFLLLCVAVPVVEEILFRGFQYAGLRRGLNVVPAALIGGLTFAAVHFPGGASQFAYLAATGVALSLVYEHTRSLWPGIVMHVLHNALVFGILMAVLAV